MKENSIKSDLSASKTYRRLRLAYMVSSAVNCNCFDRLLVIISFLVMLLPQSTVHWFFRSVKDVKQFFEPLTLQFGKLWWMKSLTLTIPPESYLIISVRCYDLYSFFITLNSQHLLQQNSHLPSAG